MKTNNDFLLFVCLLGQFISEALLLNPVMYPDPISSPTACHINNTSITSICDVADILTPNNREILSNQTVHIAGTKFCSGCPSCKNKQTALKVTLATIENVTTFSAPSLANNIRQSWNRSICQNDILILLTKDTQKVHLSTGAVAAPYLPPACLAEILTSANNEYEKGDAFKAASKAFTKIIALYYTGKSQSPAPACHSKGGISNTAIILIVLAVVMVVGIVAIIVYKCVIKRRQQSYLNYRPDFEQRGATITTSLGNNQLAEITGSDNRGYETNSQNTGAPPPAVC